MVRGALSCCYFALFVLSFLIAIERKDMSYCDGSETYDFCELPHVITRFLTAVRVVAIDGLRFAVDEVAMQVVTSAPVVGDGAWEFLQGTVWLFIDATYFAAHSVVGDGRCSNTQPICTLQFNTPQQCCLKHSANTIIQRFCPLPLEVSAVDCLQQSATADVRRLHPLILEIPILGPVVQMLYRILCACLVPIVSVFTILTAVAQLA